MHTIVYCIDSSSLIGLKRQFPMDIVIGFWDKLDGLARERRLIAPDEVLNEVNRGDDELAKWIKEQDIFSGPTPEELAIVQEIMAKFRDIVDYEKETPEADPFLIALAVSRNRQHASALLPLTHIVVSEERNVSPKIPYVCKHYEVECIKGIELVRREGWRFH
jgi:hypothetical protein